MLSVRSLNRVLLVVFSATLLSPVAYGDVIADSVDDWSADGILGENGWVNGYRNFTEDGGEDYDHLDHFLFFINDGTGDAPDYIGNDHTAFIGNSWVGDEWRLQGGDLGSTGGPWTILNSEFAHPNGTNSASGGKPEEHWVIRRWEATIDEPMNLELATSLAAQNVNCGNGTTVHLFQNGNLLHSLTNDSDDPVEGTHIGLVQPGDLIDLALTPEGIDGERGDPCDGSLFRLTILESSIAVGPSCDFDGSGTCDVVDIDLLLDGLGGGDASLDLNSDGTIDLADRDEWLSAAGNENIGRPYPLGDFNLDGKTDATDLNLLGLSWQSDAPSWGNGDVNGDNVGNAGDLNEVGLNWLAGTEAAASTAAVPEPATSVLILLGMLALSATRRSATA